MEFQVYVSICQNVSMYTNSLQIFHVLLTNVANREIFLSQMIRPTFQDYQ